MAERTVPLQLGLGVANRLADTKLPPGYVKQAQNVDISRDGVVSRRDGYEQFFALAGAHSLWSHRELMYAIVASGANLQRLLADGTTTSIATGLSGNGVHYCLTPMGVYWSDASTCGGVSFAGEARSWGVELPESFAAAATSTGGLDAGTYGVTVTFTGDSGEEGGAAHAQYIPVPAGGGINIMTPTARAFDTADVRVYATTANGSEMQYVGSTVPAAQYTIGPAARGRPLRTDHMLPFPAVLHPCYKNGRLFGAIGRLLIWSEPLYYGLFSPTKNFIALRGDDITMVAAPDSEEFMLYIGTKKRTYKFSDHYKVAGQSLGEATLTVVSHQGVVEGSMAMVSPEAAKLEGVLSYVPVWVDAQGIPIAGTADGLVPLHDKFAYPVPDTAASIFFEGDGDSRYMMGGRGAKPSVLAVGDRVVARVIDAGGGA